MCPDCLRDEFRKAPQSVDVAEHDALLDEFEVQGKRQMSRAARMGVNYRTGSVFNWVNSLRLIFGLALFILTVFVFLMLENGLQDPEPEAVDVLGRRIVALLMTFVAAMLVGSSFRPLLAYPLGLLMVGTGWFLPNLSRYLVPTPPPAEEKQAEKNDRVAEDEETAEVMESRALQESDLDVFEQLKKEDPQGVHYAVYLNRQDAHTRSIVRDALSRLLNAENTTAYTREEGALFVVTRARGHARNRSIAHIVSRFGHITYSDPKRGIYEVRFEPDRVNLVSRFPVEVLAEPTNPSYVTANIEELTCLDPMRIRSAAKSLHRSNVRMLRTEVRETLLNVMQDPWNTDYDTYSALAEALTTYAAKEKDAAAIEACRKFFRVGLAMKREIPSSVTMYLVREVPDEMVEPIVEFWCENPIAWTEPMAQLGSRTQDPLVKLLDKTNNLRLIGTIIRYLKDQGDRKAIEHINPFLTHQDAIIRHSAQDAIRAIEARNK